MEQSNQISSRRRRSKRQIQYLLNEFEKSKTTIKAFCKLHNVSKGSFHKWKSRYLSKQIKEQEFAGFATIEIVGEPAPLVQGLFAEVRGIRIYQPVSASFLKELLT